MIYQTFSPAPRFKDLVRFYWVLESDLPYTHYGMADVCPELVFHYKGVFDELLEDNHREKSFVSGLSAQGYVRRRFEIKQGFGIFGVYLYPHALSLLFEMPADELTNQMPDLQSLLPQSLGKDLEDKILHACHTKERIQIIEEFFEKKLALSKFSQLPFSKVLQTIIKTPEITSVKYLAENYCLSERQLERQFKQFSGLSPKQFLRIVRFHRAMNEYGNTLKSLTQIALDCGYYDQSHFIRDFKEFSGLNPKQFFAPNSEANRWRQ